MQVMPLNNTNRSTSFEANLNFRLGIRYKEVSPFGPVIDRTLVPICEIPKEQKIVLMNKFKKATKDIPGTLTLDYGSYFPNPYETKGSQIIYCNGKFKDSISARLKTSVSNNENFINKLVKMLELFKHRENNFNKIEKMKNEIKELEQSTKKDSIKTVENLFGKQASIY